MAHVAHRARRRHDAGLPGRHPGLQQPRPDISRAGGRRPVVAGRRRDRVRRLPRADPDGAAAMRLLIAEDEPDLAHAVRRALEEEHFAVDVALDGDEAQFLLSEIGYDAVVLDLMIPKR